MHHALVFHDHSELHQQPTLGCQSQQPRKVRVVEFVTVIIRMEPDAGHAVLFDAAAELFLPVRQFRIDRAEGQQQTASVATALVGQPRVHRGDVLVQ